MPYEGTIKRIRTDFILVADGVEIGSGEVKPSCNNNKKLIKEEDSRIFAVLTTDHHCPKECMFTHTY